MGIRLGDITRAVPKPLLEGGEGVAFQGVVIEQVARQGFTDVILLARHRDFCCSMAIHFSTLTCGLWPPKLQIPRR
jgi:NDP-sugar pyrophosphorylase family protein